ncbi:MAG TPA: multiheme c-type cytochrome, partial [Planctomycetaceae bacterium]|nr:multiheme c-type cytochrome [Planctomycetaceae bacterium]
MRMRSHASRVPACAALEFPMPSTDPTAPESPRPRRAVGWRVATLLGGAVAIVAIVVVLTTHSKPPALAPRPAVEPVPAGLTAIPEASTDEANQRAIAYVGMDACVSCHSARCAEFQGTRHFQACVEPSPGKMPAEFATGGEYHPGDSSLRFEMGQKDHEFVVSAVRETPQGEQRTQSPIAFVYGSGAGTDEVFFTWHGDRLYELPIVWLHPLNSWGADPFDPHGSGDFSREWTVRCVECHNTWFEYVPGSLNEYKRDKFLLGVTCEKCHGPGRLHVEHHAANPDDKIAHAITLPRDLPRDRQMDLCALCHSNSLYHRRPPFSYTPGEKLDDYYRTLQGTQHPEQDHVANQVGYLKQSRCYTESESLTCTSCHNPHRPRPAEHAGVGESACMRCHQPADCHEQPRLPTAVQTNCVGCHMPVGNKIQVYFQTEGDAYVAPVKRWEHRIAVYPRARDTVMLEWLRTQTDPDSQKQAAQLTAKLADDWTQTAESCHDEYRYLAEIDAWRHVVELRPTAEAREKLAAAIDAQARIDGDFSEASRFSAQGRYPEAIKLL